MKAHGGVDVWIHTFLNSASRSGRFTSVERAPGTHWIGGWINPRAGLDDLEKGKFLSLSGLELWPLGRPASSQSLYRLHILFHSSLPNSTKQTNNNQQNNLKQKLINNSYFRYFTDEYFNTFKHCNLYVFVFICTILWFILQDQQPRIRCVSNSVASSDAHYCL
jgi:hypothetical protein